MKKITLSILAILLINLASFAQNIQKCVDELITVYSTINKTIATDNQLALSP